VKASTKTVDAVRKRAEDFSYISIKGNFEEEAAKLNIKPLDIPQVTKNSFIPGAGQNKNITKFAFSEDIGKVSSPFKIQGGYAVYYIADKSPEGYMKFEEIKENMLKPRVISEKKLDILKSKAVEMKGLIQNNDINSLKNVNQTVTILNADSMTVSKPNSNVGNEFEVVNAIFKLQNGQISDPLRSSKGYFIVSMNSITPFDQQKYLAEADKIRNELLTQKKQNIVQEWINELKQNAVIVDNRDKYYR
jgi:parvulin-like peptidyl-prolyl isomerase